MTPEQNTYFDELNLLFVQPGWVEFIKTFEDFKKALVSQAYSFKTMEDYFFAKGRMDSFDQVLGFKEMIEDQHKSAIEADSDIDTDAQNV